MTTSALSSPMPLRGESETKIPRLVYGTAWKKDKTADLVYQALKAGFRGIDTAAQPRHYQEGLVGDGIRRAIQDGIVERKDLFVRPSFLCPNLKYPPIRYVKW
jgi:diketogulonate reductase-like aldo/keto reductase